MNLLSLLPMLGKWFVPNKPVWTSLTFMAGTVWALLDFLAGHPGLLGPLPAAVQTAILSLATWFDNHAVWLIGLGIAKRFSDTKGNDLLAPAAPSGAAATPGNIPRIAQP